MQYQKAEIRSRILKAGKEEFLNKGYRAGKISTITKNAGVAVGNLYRYFDGKSGLLDAIVGETYTKVPKQFIAIADNIGEKPDMMELANQLAIEVKKIFDRYGEELLILWDKCHGSKYEDFRKNLHDLVCEYIKKHIFPEKDRETQLFACFVSSSFLNMLIGILRRKDEINQEDLIKRIILFYFLEVEKRI